MGTRTLPPPSAAARELRRLSDRLVRAARPLKLLELLAWPPAAEPAFLAAGGDALPRITADSYAPLPFDPAAAERDLAAVEADTLAGFAAADPAARLLTAAAREYAAVARLLAARGTPAFAGISRDIYGRAADAGWVPRVRAFLDACVRRSPVPPDDAEPLSAPAASAALANRLAGYFGPACPVTVQVADRLAADAAAAGTALKVRSAARFAAADVGLLEVHEGWVHLGTTLNGRAQPVFTVLSKCPPAATRTQEGLAVFLELLTGTAHPGRLRDLRLRLDALVMADRGADFRDVYRFFAAAGLDAAMSYRRTVRVFRGGLPAGGAFFKDVCYARGLWEVANFAAAAPADLPWLFCGKASLAAVPALKRLAAAGLVEPPRYVPPIARDAAAVAARLAALPPLAAAA